MNGLVHIVDDDAAFRRATKRLLGAQGYQTAEYATADQFLEKVRTGIEVGCILLDVNLPGLSGPELQQLLFDFGSPFPIVFLTGHGDIPMSVRAIKSGAEDFLTKPACAAALFGAIDRAIARHEAQRGQQQWLREGRALLETLTPREREVFDFIVRGNMNKQTAFALGITERTIKAHRQRIFSKLGAHSIADLVSFAERMGLMKERSKPESNPGA